MELRYEEWLPATAGLKRVVTAYWQVVGDGSKVPSAAVLPDGHVELVFNFGAAVGLSGPAFTGDQPPSVVVGPLSQAVKMEYRGPVNTFGIRFHPARGAAFFGQPAPALADKLLPLAQVSAPLDNAFSSLLAPDWSPESQGARAALDHLLLEQLASSSPVDPAIITLVDRLTSSEDVPPVAQIARDLGLSPRQVQRRFLASVGVPPKQFVRVFRFARLWQIATMSAPETWAALAADHGYADQAHMIREFRSFGVEPPAHFFSPDWYDTTAIARASGPAGGRRRNVRSVQDASRKRR